MGEPETRVLLLAARQPELVALLEQAGFRVENRTRPLNGDEVSADIAVVFRGRLLGRNQATFLAAQGIPVVEVLTVDPPSPSTGRWIRLSNRIAKTDLVQVVRAAADWARSEARPVRAAS